MFRDGFDDGDASDWVPLLGSWLVESGTYGCASSFGWEIDFDPLRFLDGSNQGLYACQSFAPPDPLRLDYAVEAAVSPFHANEEGDWNAGFLLRWLGPGESITVWMGRDGLTIARVLGSTTTVLAHAPGSYPTSPGAEPWYHLAASVRGATITAATSTGLALEVEDIVPAAPAGAAGAGLVGLVGFARPFGVHVHFDDVVIAADCVGPVPGGQA